MRERFLDLPHLGARQMPDLGREPFERRREEGEAGEQFGMPVAGDDLGGEWVGLEPEAFTRDPFDLRFELCVRSDGSGELADAIRLERPQQAPPPTVELERPARKLPSERDRLGVDAV